MTKQVHLNPCDLSRRGSPRFTKRDLQTWRAMETALAEFFQFLQCQLCLEASLYMETEMKPQDQNAVHIWPLFKQWTIPNIGKKEKWVPFHTVLAPHEFFVVEQIHHNKDLDWTEYQRRWTA